ncbi:hypothetical protein LZK98_18595 [Sphingomonas cannabina]|uniref:hypothetical protein n=1 Tax=Sphingomonas cannabina TaxID=2899123 RepID=UPI001F490A12|nr:hypothetical protein [Sphingomonas cannabina]UIJ45032.1 hypothetical protein LZK98_18595 [Sphingomonas cannabina]
MNEDHDRPIPQSPLDAAPAATRRLLAETPLGTVEIPRPPLETLPYRAFVMALLGCRGFKLDFNRLASHEALALVSDKLLGPGAFAAERMALANDIVALAAFAGELAGGRPAIAIRTYFAPGDLVWHVDRVNERTAFRLLWPIGRPAGMCVTPTANVDVPLHRAYMRREHPLLCRLDTRVMRTGAAVERLWAHRPAQLAAMMSGTFPFIRDSAQVRQVTPGAASIHRVETPTQPGTYHCSSWGNRRSPGLQIVITAASDQP